VAVLIGLREVLQRLLAVCGALVALWTFTSGAAIALGRSLKVPSAQPQLVLIIGGVGSLVVALFYVPAATALQRRGQSLCGELFPHEEAREASAILSLAEDRRKLRQLLGIDRGVAADLQTGLAILCRLTFRTQSSGPRPSRLSGRSSVGWRAPPSGRVRLLREPWLGVGNTSPSAGRVASLRLKPRKCHEFETDLGDIGVRQPGKPR
jgi:hypothetical protein